MKSEYPVQLIAACALALSIPGVLVMSAVEAKRYQNLSSEVAALERKQETLIEDNKRLVTDISVLSSSSRVEKMALGELMMHRADSDEIIRVGIGEN